MGYTHYWYRPAEIPLPQFAAIRADFQRVIVALDDMGVRLAGGLGEGPPEVDDEAIRFNGDARCGHKGNESISIPWPAPKAQGVGDNAKAVSGSWFCDGDCSYETFAFARVFDVPDYQRKDKELSASGLYFACCKTAFRPYDVAVTAFLIIAKQHLGDRIRVSSDGDDEQWDDAKRLCYTALGYGPEYRMTSDGLVNTVRPEFAPFPLAV